MSIQNTQNQIASIDREIHNLEQQIITVDRSIVNKQKDATGILEKISREKDLNRAITYQKDYSRKQEEISRIEKDKSSKNKTLSDKKKKRSDLMIVLYKEEQAERDKIKKQQQVDHEKIKKDQKELLTIQQQITREMERQKSMSIQSVNILRQHQEIEKNYDVFISHASEDKDSFVRPFVTALVDKGLNVWYDEFELKVGYSLRRSIDKGLSNSTFGIVVLSKFFFQKEWPQKELDGLFAREINGEQIILPIWHEISKNEVLKFSPTIADLLALNTSSFTIDELAEKIAERILK
jgi:hypothetical protein